MGKGEWCGEVGDNYKTLKGQEDIKLALKTISGLYYIAIYIANYPAVKSFGRKVW